MSDNIFHLSSYFWYPVAKMPEPLISSKKVGNIYYIAQLYVHTPFVPKVQIWCFSMIELIKTKILSYHKLNLVQK